MAVVLNTADGTVLSGKWFHSFDNSATSTNTFPLKTKDSTQQIFYLEEFGISCLSSSSNTSKYSIFDNSTATGKRKIIGSAFRQETGGGRAITMDFRDDPIVFADGSTICFSAGGVGTSSGAFIWIKGYTGL